MGVAAAAGAGAGFIISNNSLSRQSILIIMSSSCQYITIYLCVYVVISLSSVPVNGGVMVGEPPQLITSAQNYAPVPISQ
jgi:hypothetical protein